MTLRLLREGCTSGHFQKLSSTRTAELPLGYLTRSSPQMSKAKSPDHPASTWLNVSSTLVIPSNEEGMVLSTLGCSRNTRYDDHLPVSATPK